MTRAFTPKPLSAKREMEIQKSWDEYYIRLKQASWQNSPTAEWSVRLLALTLIQPSMPTRTLFNLTRANSQEFIQSMSAPSLEPILEEV